MNNVEYGQLMKRRSEILSEFRNLLQGFASARAKREAVLKSTFAESLTSRHTQGSRHASRIKRMGTMPSEMEVVLKSFAFASICHGLLDREPRGATTENSAAAVSRGMYPGCSFSSRPRP